MSSHSQAHSDAHEVHVHGGPGIYTKILLALLCLTVLTVFVARHPFDNNAVNVIIALAVATTKAILVGMIFMHLWYDSKVNLVVILASFIFLGIMLGSILTDVLNRDEYLPTTYGTTGAMPEAAGGLLPELGKAHVPNNTKGEGEPRQDKINPSDNAAPSTGEVKAEEKTPSAQQVVNPVGKKAPVADTISGRQ